MPITRIVFIFAVIFFFSCKKDNNALFGGGYSPPEYVFVCDSSLAPPITGWQDTTSDKDKDVQKILYNPVNGNEVIYVVKSKNYYSEMFLLNLQTKVAISIDKSIYTMPSINKFGWLTYCKANFQVYKIKYNGDSLTQLTHTGANFPRWDYSGNKIYYTQESIGNLPAQLMIINKIGTKLDSISSLDGILGISNKSNKIIAKKNPGSQLFIKNLDTGIETTLRQGSYNYYNLTFDNSDANIFWWDNKGIYKLNLSNLKLDTLVKTCPLQNFLDTPSFNLYATNISPNSNKLTFTLVTNKKLHTPKLFQEYHALEMDIFSNRITEIKLFN